MTGKEAQTVLDEVGITLNMNSSRGIPGSRDPSGIRFGTPAITTRGSGERMQKSCRAMIKFCEIKTIKIKESVHKEINSCQKVSDTKVRIKIP